MAFAPTEIRNHIPARKVRPIDANKFRAALDSTVDVDGALGELSRVGINVSPHTVSQMMAAMDDSGSLSLQTVPSAITPIQFLQHWLPGFVHVVTAARKIDQLIGITAAGSWEDEEIIQGVMEPTARAVPYTDWGNVPYSSYNANFQRRHIVRFEQGFSVGRLEEQRVARARINSAAEKRNAATLQLEIERNRVGFYGYNAGTNLTYGFLNDPALPAYQTVAAGTGGTAWANKTFLEITADIREAAAALHAQSGDLVNPRDHETTLALPTSAVQYLTVTSDFGVSVEAWIKGAYPKMRIESAPELDAANGGANVFYLYAESLADGSSDGGSTWVQPVPAKFQALGVERRAKVYLEDFTNATAGAWLKRPFLVVRRTGI